MSAADSEIVEIKRWLEENRELLEHAAKQYQEAGQKESNFIKWKIDFLLERRRKLYQLLEQKVPSDDRLIRIDNAEISSSSIIIGNLVVSEKEAGRRDKRIQPRFCERCGGMINYDEVYPDSNFDITIVNHVGCRCP